MALFGEALSKEIENKIEERFRVLGTALAANGAVENNAPGEPAPLQRDLRLLIGVSNGEYSRSDAMVRRVELALNRVEDLLRGTALGVKAAYPDGFWNTDVGVLISRARWWISIDDLITISNAAALAFGENSQANRMRIARAIDNGQLEWVPDPSVANPQQNRRVLRTQVERLRDLSSLPSAV